MRQHGWPDRVSALVAHHSGARFVPIHSTRYETTPAPPRTGEGSAGRSADDLLASTLLTSPPTMRTSAPTLPTCGQIRPDCRATTVAVRGGRTAANPISDHQTSAVDRGTEPTAIQDPRQGPRLEESGRTCVRREGVGYVTAWTHGQASPLGTNTQVLMNGTNALPFRYQAW